MIIDDQRKEQIKGVFALVSQYKEDAKESTAAASEAMKGLVESMSADKEERKIIAKAVKKAFVEYLAEQKGEEDSLADAITIINALKLGQEE